jgi:hypothetical protein
MYYLFLNLGFLGENRLDPEKNGFATSFSFSFSLFFRSEEKKG